MALHFQRELDRLRKRLLEIGSMVEEAVDRSIRALLDRDQALARETITGDTRIDRAEVEVEEDCLKLLALYQPVAGDLRLVASVLKINNDLERMGDLAVNIAERVEVLAGLDMVAGVSEDLELLARKSRDALRRSLDSFTRQDTALAREICSRDDEVDDLNRKIIERLKDVMRNDREHVDAALQLFSISRHLERIADHATNIAEDVVYLVEGQIVRHPHG